MAGWYRTGSVSLTQGSAVVVGAGATLWASALRAGMVFTTDFTTLYEVTAVTDDSHLTLDRPWTGSAVTGAAYAVIYGGAAISNAEIVAELMTMVGKWQTREDQYDDWLAGEPDGGPNGDGRYPLTDSKGATRLVTSPGRLLWLIDEGLLNNVQQVVDAIRDDIADAQRAADVAASAAVTLTAYVTSADSDRQAAEAARDAARAAETAAGLSAAAAATAAGTIGTSAATAVDAAGTAVGARDAAVIAHTAAEGARNAALGARDTAVQARDSSLQARDVSTQARDQAVASQTAAGASQARAQEAMSTAVNAAADSVDAKIHAVAAQVVAEQRRNEASGFADSAKAWAVNPVGLPVVSGGFSALHWADLARGYAQQAQVIAGGYMFGAVGDGAASRISAQAAADVLHLVQGAGMIINFDQVTRKVTFSSIARAVASEDPALTVRLDEAAALAYLGIDRSKLDHGTLVNVGTHGHTEIDAHLDNTTIHVPAPGSGDVDKLLKATGAGTFAWVKGTGSGIDADKLDGLSWEEGVEVAANTGTADWVKLGRWTAVSSSRRLLITCTGSADFNNAPDWQSSGISLITATAGGNGTATAANIEGHFTYAALSAFTAVKFVQAGNRYTYDVFVQRLPWTSFNFKVQCNGTWTTAIATGQADPGADSATVRAAVNLGRLLTTADVATAATANSVAQRDANGGIAATEGDLRSPAPALYWTETDQPTDAGRWRAIASNGRLTFQAVNAAASDARTWLELTASGYTPSKATFSVPLSIVASSSEALNVLRADGNRYAFLGYHATAEYGRIGAYGGSAWRNLTVNEGGSLVAVGTTTMPTGAAKMNVAGGIQVDGSLVWTAATFDPATKAGTAVATVAANGLMAAADKAMMNNATASATAGALVRRDDDGAAQFTGLRINGNQVWHAGNLAPAVAPATLIGASADFNTLSSPGLYQLDRGGSANANGPDAGLNHSVVHIGGSGRGLQIASTYSGENLYFRRGDTGWQPWRTLVHSGNWSQLSPTFANVTVGGSITGTLAGNASTATTASKVANTLTRGSYLTGGNFDGSAATTWAVDATSANTAGKVIARDANGDFAAGRATLANATIGGSPAMTANNGSAANLNRIRNSRMRIAERGSGPWTAGGYTVDGFIHSVNGVYAGATQASRVADMSAASRANWMLELKTTAVPAAPAAGDFFGIAAAIEGNDVQDLNWGAPAAKPLTIAFRVNTNVAGTYSLAIRNALYNCCYVATYTLVAGDNTVTLTIPGPTTGTWYADNRAGLHLYWTLAAGSASKTASVNAWQSINVFCASSQVNFAAAAGNSFRLTDTVAVVGNTVLPFAAYDQPLAADLAKCQRYYARIDVDWCGYVPAGYSGITTVSLPVPMRDLPSCTHSISASNNLNYIMNYGTFSNSVRTAFAGPASGMIRALYYLYASAEL
uniref:pyocin knob domain-containing protein n=1 Tax=Azospirillum argentinense TaxID=2970906 RepID=UPI00158613E4|nr:pyocin knob domain-containing protein [Azospirillum argentinense]